MAAKKRIRKHDLKEDRFVTATFQLTSFVREHQNTFLTVLAAVIVLVIVIFVYTSSRSRTQETVMRLAGEANIAYQRANFQEAMQHYQALIDLHGGTQEASMAAFFLAPEALMNAGRSYFSAGEVDKAIEAYQMLIDNYPESRYHDEAKMASAEITCANDKTVQ